MAVATSTTTTPSTTTSCCGVPLSQLCVAAGVADGTDGKIRECNELFRELVHKDDTNTSLNVWELAQAKRGENEEIRNKVVTLSQGPNVPSKWVRVHLTKLHDNNNSWLIQLEDVDAGLRAKNQWSAILETTYDGFWDYHIPKDYEYMSPRFWEMFGYDAKEKDHKPSEWMDMIHPDDLKASFADLERHFGSKGEIPYCRETRYQHKEASKGWVWVLCRGKVIEWDETTGAPLRMIGTHTDITESKHKAEREKELLAANESFKAEKQLNEFVSHEVRNPLAAAIASTQFLEMELANSNAYKQEIKEDVLIVAHSLEYIHQLLTSMLDLNKFLEKGGVQLTPRPTLLKRDVTTPVYQLYKHRADKLQFQIQHWWISPEDSSASEQGLLQPIPDDIDPRLQVDVVRLKQILVNLVSNAIKFTREGFVRVLLGRFQKDKPDTLTIVVEDTGPGIPDDKRDLLFQKYVQLSSQIQGSGIGLALTKQLVEAMKGTIAIDESYKSGFSAAEGHSGTRFVVTIEAPIVEASVPMMAAGGAKTTVVPASSTNPMEETKNGDNNDKPTKPPTPTKALPNSSRNGNSSSSRLPAVMEPPPKHPSQTTTTTKAQGGVQQQGHPQQHDPRYYHHQHPQYSPHPHAPPPPMHRSPHHHSSYGHYDAPPPPPPPAHHYPGQPYGGPPPPPPPHSPYYSHYRPAPPPPPPPHYHDSYGYYGGASPAVHYQNDPYYSHGSPPPPQPQQQQPANGGHAPDLFSLDNNPRPLMNDGSLKVNGMGDSSRHSHHHYQNQYFDDTRANNGGDGWHGNNSYASHHTAGNRNPPSTSKNTRSNGAGNGSNGKLTANLKVLVVDDDPIIRKLLTRRLRNIDPTMTVDTVESGELAIERIKNNNDSFEQYDLVMMDHFMPLGGGKLTGEETIRIIRPYVQGIIAGSSGNDMRREHTDAGADLFWLKPVPKDDVLLNDLHTAFQQVKQQRQG